MITMKLDLKQIEAYMESCMTNDAVHDAEHVRRVVKAALVITDAEEGPVDRDVLTVACLLHDIGRKEELADRTLCHARVGAEKARRYLLGNGYDESFAAHVADCIRTHRFRSNDPPVSIEAKILFDADKLDVTGAIGIARTLAYQSVLGTPLYVRNADGTISDGREGRENSFIGEYHRKLKSIYDRFYTKKGAELARDRQAIAVVFCDALLHEINT